ncbi:MAG: GNAT family N-acetyltransferase [Planctomycetota bacterium]
MASELSVLHLETSNALRAYARQWDDLWYRSEVTQPTAQAPLIANWLDYYHPDADFRAIVISQGKRFLAALPLVTRVKRGLIRCLDVPGNEWSAAGDLLLDPACDMAQLCGLLVGALNELGCPPLWLASVPIEARRWKTLMAAAAGENWRVAARGRYQVGRLRVPSRWTPEPPEELLLSKGMRKRIRRATRQLEARGTLRLHVVCPTEGELALSLLETGLKLEHAGWKGRAGTSLMTHPRARRFVEAQTIALVAKQQLSLALLELDGEIMAFEYGWRAKNVYHSYKIAYSEAFSRFSPGQLLLYHLLHHFSASNDINVIDFVGPADDAVRRWHPRYYAMGRLLMAPPTLLGRAMVSASRHFSLNASVPGPTLKTMPFGQLLNRPPTGYSSGGATP